LLPPYLLLAVLRDLSRLFLPVLHGYGLLSVRRSAQRVPRRGPEIEYRRVGYNLIITNTVSIDKANNIVVVGIPGYPARRRVS
jgi:hypothetical protein